MYKTVSGVDFRFSFHSHGWSYAEVRIHTKSKVFGLFPYWKHLWSTCDGFGISSALACHVEKAHRHELERWCDRALNEYLSYAKSWSN